MWLEQEFGSAEREYKFMFAFGLRGGLKFLSMAQHFDYLYNKEEEVYKFMKKFKGDTHVSQQQTDINMVNSP